MKLIISTKNLIFLRVWEFKNVKEIFSKIIEDDGQKNKASSFYYYKGKE